MYRFLLLVLVFQFSCDEQSNPYVGEIESEHLESLGYESRDVLVLNDIEFNLLDCISLEESDCIEDIWCNWDDGCTNASNDLLVVANQYEEGLIIYDINTSETGISLDEIYANNNFEVINDISIENDLEIRQLVYDKNFNMLYILDKFEYIYQIWLPIILEQSTDNLIFNYNIEDDDETNDCITLGGDLIPDPISISTFTENEKLHATQLILDQNNQSNPPNYEIIYLLKYNTNISSDSSIPDPSETSCSTVGSFSFTYGSPFDQLGQDALVCDALYNVVATPFEKISPLFDYGVTDIYKNNNILIVANAYDPYVFRNEIGNDLDIKYYEGSYENGCDLPNNAISMTDNGMLLYNISSEVNYFEFNLVNVNLSTYYPDILIDYYYQYPSNYFQGFIKDYSNVAIGISGNKVMGYIESSPNIPPMCGTLIDLGINEDDNPELVHKNIHSISIYNYNSIDNIEFDYDIKTNAKPVSVYNNEEYLIAGLKDDGCYIKLLGNDSQEMTKFGCYNFTVNDIVYDDVNNKLLLSCGNDGVLIYNWAGNSMSPVFQNHIISSFAYKAKIYVGEDNNTYVIVATEYGVEIYSL